MLGVLQVDCAILNPPPPPLEFIDVCEVITGEISRS